MKQQQQQQQLVVVNLPVLGVHMVKLQVCPTCS
jgi:hypothetical protein